MRFLTKRYSPKVIFLASFCGFLFSSPLFASKQSDFLNELKDFARQSGPVPRGFFKQARIRLSAEVSKGEQLDTHSSKLEDRLVYTTILIDRIEGGKTQGDVEALREAWAQFERALVARPNAETHHALQELFSDEPWKLQEMLKKYNELFDFLNRIKVKPYFMLQHSKCDLLELLGDSGYNTCIEELSSRPNLLPFQVELLVLEKFRFAARNKVTEADLAKIESQIALLKAKLPAPKGTDFLQMAWDEIKLSIAISEGKATEKEINAFRSKYNSIRAESRLITRFYLAKRNFEIAQKAFESLKQPTALDPAASPYWALKSLLEAEQGFFKESLEALERLRVHQKPPYPKTILFDFCKVALQELMNEKRDWKAFGEDIKSKINTFKEQKILNETLLKALEVQERLAQYYQNKSEENKSNLVNQMRSFLETLPQTVSAVPISKKLIEKFESKEKEQVSQKKKT